MQLLCHGAGIVFTQGNFTVQSAEWSAYVATAATRVCVYRMLGNSLEVQQKELRRRHLDAIAQYIIAAYKLWHCCYRPKYCTIARRRRNMLQPSKNGLHLRSGCVEWSSRQLRATSCWYGPCSISDSLLRDLDMIATCASVQHMQSMQHSTKSCHPMLSSLHSQDACSHL